jgi:hypothetical protein
MYIFSDIMAIPTLKTFLSGKKAGDKPMEHTIIPGREAI